MSNDVLEYLVDGASGLAPGGVDGKALIAGVCSRGQVGKAYLVGKRTNLAEMLGAGPLVDILRDVLATGGQEPVVVAVPVRGQPGGYISRPRCLETAVRAQTAGVAQQNADIVAVVTTPGAVGTAVLSVLINGQPEAEAVSAESMPLGATGAVLLFPHGAMLEDGAAFEITARTAIGPVACFGPEQSPVLEIAGDVLAGASLAVQVVRPGGRNEGTYRLSTDNGANYGKARTIPFDGIAALPEYGVTISFPQGAYAGGVTYSCELLPPTPGIIDVMSALERPLALHDVEFVLVAGPTDAVDWTAAQAKADELWNQHRPTYFKMCARLPHDNEDLHDFAAYLQEQAANFAGRFVQVCAQFGMVTDAAGESKTRNWGGLQAGRVMSIPVQRATGRVKDGPIIQGVLPEGWEAVQPILEEACFLTAKKYAGMRGAYWGDSPTFGEIASDYRFEEIVRVAFKAVRKARLAALKSMYDEAGDPLMPLDGGGLAYLKAQFENALDTMVKAAPRELIGYVVDLPPRQDVANQGVNVAYTLIGVPIIRKIKIFASYVYAGSRFDPRLH